MIFVEIPKDVGLVMHYDTTALIHFACNICGSESKAPFLSFHREAPNCSGCGSSPRFRGTMYALSQALYGKSLIVKDFPVDKNIKGIGMSDWEGYASILTEKFSFINTFYDTAPKFDATSKLDWKNYTDCDFVLCTEVMEHVLSPYDAVPWNIRQMLKHNGTLIFSAPYTNRRQTKEHFPGLVSYASVKLDGEWVIVGKDTLGVYQVFDRDICFHGGPGSVLELRVFSESEVLALLHDAGYSVTVYDKVIPQIGYAWPSYEERLGDGVGLNYIISGKPDRF